jgi:hypothetical protein
VSRLAAVAINAVLGAVAGAGGLLIAYGFWPSLVAGLDESPPARQVTGLYPVERDPSGLTFAWTGEIFAIRLPGIDRRTEWRLTVRLRGGRSGPATNPDVTFLVDGSKVLTHTSSPDFDNVVVLLPANPGQRGATIAAQCSSTVVPGPSDPRQLGVMIDSIALAPASFAIPPARAVTGVAIAGAAAGTALGATATPVALASPATALVAIGLAALVAHGFGAYTDYPDLIARVSGWLSLLTTTIVIGLQTLRKTSWSATARFVAACSAGAALLKLGLLLHPDMPVGDAMFQAHRFQNVLGGNFYFTSIAPGNYAFPYAPGLYVLAMTFADLVTRGSGDMALLRTIVISVDAIAAALLYYPIARSGSPLAGALAVVLYHLTPLDYRIATVGNLTNAFAQSLAAIAFTIVATPAWIGRRGLSNAALFTVILTCAFVSHTSTFAVVSVAGAMIAALFLLSRDPGLRRTGIMAAIGVGVAVLAAVLLYYAHFGETYRTEWARISSETAAAAPDAGGRGIPQRVASVPRYVYLYFGIPFLILAAWGLMLMRKRRDQLTLATIGWSAACLAFLLLGLLTPVDMRYYLTAIPALAVMAGIGSSYGWARGGSARIIAAGLVAWAGAIGVQTWWRTFG